MRGRRFTSSLNFALTHGASFREKLRLGYHAAVKPSLACRGLAHYDPSRLVKLGFHGGNGRTFDVHVRDNGVGVVTIAEFFDRQSLIVPKNLPSFRPTVIYDLGANLGIASLYFSSLHPAAVIYGFEPLPENFEICTLNYRNLPPPSQVFPWAVGAQSGTAVFDCQNDSRGGRLESSPHDPRLKTTGKIAVQVHSIADLVSRNGLKPPDFLKIDVEGAELDVLNGVGEHHQGLKCVYVETHGDQLKKDCVTWLEQHGFKLWPGADDTAVWGVRC